jgi:hypothetical protein
MSLRISRTRSSGRFFGSSKTQLIRRTPGVIGQTSSLQVDRNVGPLERVFVELTRHVRACVDSDFFQGFHNLRMNCIARLASRGARLVSPLGCPPEELLRLTLRTLLATQTKRTFTASPRAQPARLLAAHELGRRARRSTCPQFPGCRFALCGSLLNEENERPRNDAVIRHRIRSILRLQDAHHSIDVGDVH